MTSPHSKTLRICAACILSLTGLLFIGVPRNVRAQLWLRMHVALLGNAEVLETDEKTLLPESQRDLALKFVLLEKGVIVGFVDRSLSIVAYEPPIPGARSIRSGRELFELPNRWSDLIFWRMQFVGWLLIAIAVLCLKGASPHWLRRPKKQMKSRSAQGQIACCLISAGLLLVGAPQSTTIQLLARARLCMLGDVSFVRADENSGTPRNLSNLSLRYLIVRDEAIVGWVDRGCNIFPYTGRGIMEEPAPDDFKYIIPCAWCDLLSFKLPYFGWTLVALGVAWFITFMAVRLIRKNANG